jgi:aerobic carbon-monoxide dehydrogenase medium subunit
MKPAAFAYHRPGSLTEAVALLATYGDELKPLAGGQSLMPMLAMRLARPTHVMDLQLLDELRRVVWASDTLRIGAMVRHRDLERDERMPAIVTKAMAHVGHFQIRNRGTVGGSLAHMDPAAEWPALALVLGGSVVTASVRGRREIPAHEFAVGPLMTALEPDELVTDVLLPLPQEGYGFAEVERRSGDFAIVGACCQDQRVVVFAAGPRPQRLYLIEAYLAAGGRPGAELTEIAGAEIVAGDDIHASAAYRRRTGALLVNRVVGERNAHIEGAEWN